MNPNSSDTQLRIQQIFPGWMENYTIHTTGSSDVPENHVMLLGQRNRARLSITEGTFLRQLDFRVSSKIRKIFTKVTWWLIRRCMNRWGNRIKYFARNTKVNSAKWVSFQKIICEKITTNYIILMIEPTCQQVKIRNFTGDIFATKPKIIITVNYRV